MFKRRRRDAADLEATCPDDTVIATMCCTLQDRLAAGASPGQLCCAPPVACVCGYAGTPCGVCSTVRCEACNKAGQRSTLVEECDENGQVLPDGEKLACCVCREAAQLRGLSRRPRTPSYEIVHFDVFGPASRLSPVAVETVHERTPPVLRTMLSRLPMDLRLLAAASQTVADAPPFAGNGGPWRRYRVPLNAVAVCEWPDNFYPHKPHQLPAHLPVVLYEPSFPLHVRVAALVLRGGMSASEVILPFYSFLSHHVSR